MKDNKEKFASWIIEDAIAKMKKGEMTADNAFCAVKFAAGTESPESQYYLAHFYLEGVGCEKDEDKGVELLRISAEGSWAAAQGELGRRYLKGEGVEQNNEEAVKWLRLAAEQGDSNAANHLVDCYVHGWGVEPDQSEVLKWLGVVAAAKGRNEATKFIEDELFADEDVEII
jgi:hypothetical protein